MKPSLDLALDYLAFNPGRYLFPIKAGFKTPPLIDDNLARASNDPEQIKAWHTKWPGCNWGIALRMSRLIVVDVDQKPGKVGAFTYSQLDLLYGWPTTETVRTPSHGLHHYYDGEHIFALGVHGFGKDVDSPNYVLIPGCTLRDGTSYDALDSLSAVPAPDWFSEFLKPHERVESDAVAVVDWDQAHNVEWAINYLKADAPPAIEGQGGEMTTLKVAMTLRDHAISEHKAGELMLEHYNVPGSCDPEWETDDLLKKINNAYSYANMRAPGASSAEAEFADDPVPELPKQSDAEKEKSDADKAAAKVAKAAGSDYYSYFPEGKYIYAPTGALWPKESVNAAAGKGATKKLDKQRPVHVMTWCPGQSQYIKNQLVIEGGWIDKHGANTFNRYRPAKYIPGNAAKVQPWRDHLRRLYPGADAEHIEKWFAYRVQYPGVKINHALVLGGATRIGKDTIITPLKTAVGAWNFEDITAGQAMDTKNNGFLESVILRISEARDFGEKDRYAFYDHLKPWLASPPEVLSVADKYIRAHPVFNSVGVIITTNYKTNGIYLPADDARHFVAWSDMTKDMFEPDYFAKLYAWYTEDDGANNVAQFLLDMDVRDWNPKAPPPQTEAFWEIVNANHAPENDDVASVFDTMARPDAVTVDQVIQSAASGDSVLNWADSRNRRQIPRQMEAAGYVSVRNPEGKEGRWLMGKKRVAVYAKLTLSIRDRVAAAQELQRTYTPPTGGDPSDLM